jgi:hypothetical protein
MVECQPEACQMTHISWGFNCKYLRINRSEVVAGPGLEVVADLSLVVSSLPPPQAANHSVWLSKQKEVHDHLRW